jgi:beta-glucanase (GH16 family)
MGSGSEGIEATGSRKAHHVGICPQEDRTGAAEKVGGGAGASEEGGLGELPCLYHVDLRLEPVRCFNSGQARLLLGCWHKGLMKALVVVLALFLCSACVVFAQTFSDDFSAGKLDASKWEVATYKSPDSKPGLNSGVYVPESLDFSRRMLCIKVTQQRGPDNIRSYGGAIISKKRFGFGTYEFVMRMSSTSATPDGFGTAISGAISSGFVFYNNSESEIDLEFLGNENAIWITNWQNANPKNAPSGDVKQTDKISNHFLAGEFHKYKLIWAPTNVKVYIDGTLVASHNEHIPQSPAYVILQHRGTNSNEWGGTATVGVTRYMYVKSVNFIPPHAPSR